MLPEISAFMKYAHDQCALCFYYVEDDVGLMIVASKLRRESICASSSLGVVCNHLKTIFQCIAIVTGLFDSEGFNRVICDLGKVRLGTGG